MIKLVKKTTVDELFYNGDEFVSGKITRSEKYNYGSEGEQLKHALYMQKIGYEATEVSKKLVKSSISKKNECVWYGIYHKEELFFR